MKKFISNLIKLISKENKQQRLLEAGASKKRFIDPKAKNPFVFIGEKK